MARGLKIRIKIVEGLYYPYSENKGADQLRSNRAADLRLCFRKCKKQVFSQRGSNGLIDQSLIKEMPGQERQIMSKQFIINFFRRIGYKIDAMQPIAFL